MRSELVHASRDEILLDGDRYGIPDDEDAEEEVFALNGMPADSDSDEDEEMDDEDDVEEEGDVPKRSKKSPKTKATPKRTSLPGFASDEDEDEEEEEDESWGRSKAAYYSSNAAELDSEDEEAHELEEQEAKRLQAKARESMTGADFGLGDVVEEVDAMDEGTGYVRSSLTRLSSS